MARPDYGHCTGAVNPPKRPEEPTEPAWTAGGTMQRIRIQRDSPRPKRDRADVLPLDPRDPDILRVKETDRPNSVVRGRAVA